MESKAFSFNNKRKLLDSNGAVVSELEAPLFSWYKWHIIKNGNKLVTLSWPVFSVRPKVRVFLNNAPKVATSEGGKKIPNFVVRGKFWKNDYQIFEVQSPGVEVAIATCSKRYPFENMNAFFHHLGSRDVYFLNINPGVDASFIVSLCICVDEIYHD